MARRKTRLDHITNDDIRKQAHVNLLKLSWKQKTKVVWPLIEARTQSHLCEIAKTRSLWEKEQRSTKQRWSDNINGNMKKHQLTECMAQDRAYWMAKIMAGPAQGDGQER